MASDQLMPLFLPPSPQPGGDTPRVRSRQRRFERRLAKRRGQSRSTVGRAAEAGVGT